MIYSIASTINVNGLMIRVNYIKETDNGRYRSKESRSFRKCFRAPAVDPL